MERKKQNKNKVHIQLLQLKVTKKILPPIVNLDKFFSNRVMYVMLTGPAKKWGGGGGGGHYILE